MNKLLSIKTTKRTLTILVLFCCSFFIYTDFNIRQFVGYGALLVGAAMQMKRTQSVSRVQAAFLLLIGSLSFFFLLSNSVKNKSTSLYIVEAFVFLIVLLTATANEFDAKHAIILFQGFGITLALVTLFFRFFPNIYWKYVIPHLSTETASHAIKYLPVGYGIPISGEFLFANYVFSSVIVISFCKVVFMAVPYRKKTILILAVVLCAMVLYGRRSEMVSTFGTLVLLYIIITPIRFSRIIRLKKILNCVAIVSILVLVIHLGSSSEYFVRYANTFVKVSNVIKQNGNSALHSLLGGNSDITSGRIELWRIAIDNFLKHPLWGTGWGTFGNYIPTAFNMQHSVGNVVHAHNDYLELLSDVGIVGACTILIPRIYLLSVSIKYAIRMRDKNRTYTVAYHLITSSIGIQLFLLIQGAIDPCFYKTQFWCFYSVSIAFLEYAIHLSRIVVTGKKTTYRL